MTHKLSWFFSGMVATTLVCSFVIGALAATGAVSFNRSPIQFNGKTISAAGEDYQLDNGCMAPSSITYTDEMGGGTTYLPARRVAELMGVEIGWDPATGAVTVTGESKTPAPTPTETPDADPYADWSEEDEAPEFDYSYEEFKTMWHAMDATAELYLIMANDANGSLWLANAPKSLAEEFGLKMAEEYAVAHGKKIPPHIRFMDGDILWQNF